jgi:hypothetical protein
MKHGTPDWMDEFLEREEFEDWEDIADFLGMSREEFWEEFWEKPTERHLEQMIESQERLDDFFQEYREFVKGREDAIAKVNFREEKVQAYVRRSDGVIQRYWINVNRLGEYRVARKGGYLWKVRK